MSAESKSSGLGSGNADLHREVRRDILVADAREIAGTLTRDLLYPLIALNRGNIDGLRRCPRFVFDTGEAEDLSLLAESLPKLVGIGMAIPAAWAHDKLRIPERVGDEPVLGTPASAGSAEPPADVAKPVSLSAQSAQCPSAQCPSAQCPSAQCPSAQCAALIAPYAAAAAPDDASLAALVADQQALDAALDAPLDWAKIADPLLTPVLDALSGGMAPEEILADMAAWYPQMDDAALIETLARALFVADCWGRLSATAGSAEPQGD